MHHLERINSLATRRGVNRTTALAIVSSLALFSTLLFFGLANAMLPDSIPDEGLGDREIEQPTGRVPALESPDGTEAVAARTPGDDQSDDGTDGEGVDDGASETSTDEANVRPQGTNGSNLRGTHRGSTPSSGGQRPSVDRGERHETPRSVATCDSSDPLCGVDFGGPLDA